MKRIQMEQAQELIRQLEKAHDQIKKYIEQKNVPSVLMLLEDCQNAGIALGTLVENTEGEKHPTVSLLEEYCELTYQLHETLLESKEQNANKIYKFLKQKMIKISNSLRNDIQMKQEAVFLPYKASMWDSLESVWKAADADPNCDTYVIPIPYYDINPDGSFGRMYYEGEQYPEYVPITKYEDFNFGEHCPDMIYIHNPYDNMNLVSSVHPFFYSENLKKFTKCLIYIPYYATAGDMSEGQALCPAYFNADYIVIQSEKYRKFFDERIPDSKFIALGSPKFDSVIHKCKNPPKPPKTWEDKMKGKKVYFYNTSIGGMLGNTEVFLKKMRYVFDIFKERKDVCLLWRPHPLLESSFDSMRKIFKPQYDMLKKEFIEENIGILDETPDIEGTIALSDVYIGDAGTSVTSLFGVAGKPVFILNNYINTLPEKDDWRGERIALVFDMWGDDRYQVTNNNQLWFSEKNDYHYKFYMNLDSEYSGGGYYLRAIELKNKIYVMPRNAQHLLIIEDKKIRKITLKEQLMHTGAFCSYWYNENYIFLFPFRYPQVIRFHIQTEQIDYIDGIMPFYVRNVNGEWRTGGIGIYENELIFASPEDSQFLFMDIDTLKVRKITCNSKSNLGIQGMVPEGESLWLMPLNGMVITRWNPKTGEIREYSDLPRGFKSMKWPYELECDERPFGTIAFSKENIVISPSWGNMYVSLDRETGEMKEWKPPIEFASRGKSGYFLASSMGGFVITIPQRGKADCRIWYTPERKLYDINIDTKECREVEITFDYGELKEHEPGFSEESEWMQYCLNENAFNSLKDLLDEDITGKQFDKERQLKAFSRINANTDGTCGENVYRKLSNSKDIKNIS